MTITPTRPAVTDRPADHLATALRYAADPYAWPFAPRFDPRRRWYRRIARDADTEAWLLTWLPGQGTDLHDHGDSSGAFVVVSGTLTEHTVSGTTGLLAHTLRAGDGRGFGADHVHRITNTSDRPAVSLHVYGPTLSRMTRYQLEAGRLRPVAVERAGVDW